MSLFNLDRFRFDKKAAKINTEPDRSSESPESEKENKPGNDQMFCIKDLVIMWLEWQRQVKAQGAKICLLSFRLAENTTSMKRRTDKVACLERWCKDADVVALSSDSVPHKDLNILSSYNVTTRSTEMME